MMAYYAPKRSDRDTEGMTENMTAILMGSPDKVRQVYAQSVLDVLRTEAGLDDTHIVTKEEIINGAVDTKDVRYIFSTWGMAHFKAEEISRFFPTLEAVFYAAGSVQYFAREFLESGISVFSAWAANAVPVAEYTVSQIILASKGFYSTSRLCHKGLAGRKEAAKRFANYRGNFGATVGIIGAGMIGTMVIERLKAYKLNAAVYDPFLTDERAKMLGVAKCSLEELFANCDVISNHVANLPATVGMMRKEHFASMKPYASFINTGRGAQIVEPDMIAVLTERQDLTAVLDVTWPEPPEENSPLYSLENVFLTPHIAGSAGDEVVRMAEYMAEEFRAFAAGKPTKYSVSMKMLETMA